ncbi:unnamed protein product (macronuclear) [Paramecium tetraurelia]|uniref:Tyrosine-protein phosphatase domain-containing protein n=1 Tax=Paramecium tetraurelia TaxID=5888 RepID=A0CMR9_PARTE|nr:uncharacterized protein GSPATT00008565001 [Paramecium tetraurelia]CAK72086.1 unnamed protein product [Paramecium tetraurelia]|eukprot:XP_001439483.1 hypothetical protein (macronuclear) [Paramecium tetraurelia strain d4-2]
MIRPYLYYAFKIKDGLFIGNKRAANDIQFQFYNKITVIINCAALEINISNPKVKILNFEWLDTEEQQIVVNNNVDMVYNTIEETNDNGESVLICCLTGQSRSVAIVAAYFMKKFNWNLKTSLQYLQICRKDFEIREGFLFQLSRYERELLIKLKTDLTEQNEQVQEQEILLKNTYYNAKLSEIWSNYNMSEKTSGFSKGKHKKHLKRVSWAQKLITFINTTLDCVKLNLFLNQKNESVIQKQSLFKICKGNTEKKSSRYMMTLRNKTPDPITNMSISTESKYRCTSVVKQIESDAKQFQSNRKSLTKGEKYDAIQNEMTNKIIMIYFLLLIVVTYQQKCQWVDEDNHKYDYTNLDHPSAWHVVDTQNGIHIKSQVGMGMFNMVYIFNFCNINLSCHGVPVAVYEGLEVMGTITDNCDIVGLKSTTSISHIQDKPKDYGISISFNDNSQCVETANQNRAVQTDKPRTAIFNIVCSEKAEKQFRIVQGYGCTVTLEIYHPAGCPLNGNIFSYISFALKCFIIATILFNIVGFIYNKKIRKITGKQAIPNIKQLEEIKKLVIYALQNCERLVRRGGKNGYQIV